MNEARMNTADGTVDEMRIVRAVALGLPLVTIAAAGAVGVIVGPALSILVLAAGLLLGVIGLLWSSVRILSGDAALSPELEALDIEAHGVDSLAGRKKMLLRALKDLQNEHAIGKMEDDDYQQLSSTYRAELKTLLQRIDDTLAPHRAQAENMARRHLANRGLGSAEDALALGAMAPVPNDSEKKASAKTTAKTPARTVCPKCDASNEPDAKFCKECATKLTPAATTGTEGPRGLEAHEDADV